MKSPKGIITGNRNDKKRGIKVLKAISTDNTYEVLVKSIGTDFSDTWSFHKFKIRTVDLTGTIVDPGIWRDKEYALAYGWEEKFGDIIKPDGVVVAKGFFDQNNDGLVDDTNQSLILHEGVGLTIKNPNGVTRGNRNDKKTGIKILKAISSDNGYEILVKGTGTNFNDKWSRYKFTQWTVDQTGTITDFGTWRDHEYALVYGWEEKFGDVIKRDGVITPPPRNTFFVSLDGDDNNPGTLEAPFRTIKMGLQRIGQTRDVPGGTLTIRGGTYRLPIGRYKWGEYNQEDTTIGIIGLHGDKDDPIRIQNYQDEEVIISGAKKIKPRWEKHEGNIWKTEVKYLPSQLFLDGKMLTGARWPNITKNWDQLDDSNANNPTPGSYWHPDTWANSASKLPAVDLKGAVVVPIDTEGAPGNIIKVIKKKPAEATDMILEDREYGITWNDPIEDWNARPDDGEKCNSCIPSTYYLTNHLNLLDQPGEWHLEQRHSSKKVETSYGTDYVLKREPSVLYVWMPDGSDPNQRNIEARAFSNVPLLSQENNLLNINKSSNIIFDGITFHTGEINLNGAKNITFDNSKFLYSGHHAHMIADTESGEHNLYGHGGYVNLQTNNMGYAGDEGERIGLGFEKERNITISNSEIAYTFGGAFLTWGKGVSGNTIDNVYFHNKVGGDNAFEFGRDSANNKVRRLEYHTFGWGGVGRIGNQIWRTQEYGGNDYPTSVIELSRVYNPFWHGDDAGFQINQGQVYNLVVRQNWLHDLPGRNGIRFDGDPAGFGGTAHHNVSFNNRRGFRLKGDHHTVLNNVAFHNDQQDVRVTEDRFYGWRPGKGSGYNDAGCSPTDRMLRNGDWYCTKYPSDYVKQELVPELLSNANSIIHNNAGDKDSGMNVHSPADSTNNSMGKEARNGSYMRDELRDVYNFDFRPKAGSSLIDQGKHIPGYTDGYIGSAPDIGAYEYGDENYWIPGYQTKKAKTPIPQNGAYDAKLDTDLMWLEGRNSISNDIYFGSDPSDLQFQGNQTNNIFTPKEPLTAGQTYYWRIDTVTDQETIPGDVWMFAPDNPEKPDAPGVPIFSSAATSTDGTKVLLTYNETLSSTTAAPSDFTVALDGKANPVTAVAISGSTVELSLTTAVSNDQVITITYSDPSGSDDTNAIQNSAGKDAASLSASVTNYSTIGVNNPKNQPPTALTLINTVRSLPENTSTDSRIKIADIAITDDNLGTNLITLAGTDANRFEIDGTVLFLKAEIALDFETQATYSISLTATDPELPGSRPVSAIFSLAVDDLAELPQIQSIDDIKLQSEITIFSMITPVEVKRKSLVDIIIGTKKKDNIIGSSEGEILAGLEDKDVLKGGDGSDAFLFGAYAQYGTKRADIIKDFNPSEGDSILLDKDVFGLGNKIKLKIVNDNNGVDRGKRSKNHFIYDDRKGFLYFNDNGKKLGWGDGGLFAKLHGAPELGAEDFTIV